MVELKGKILGVEEGFEGIVIIIQQEKMKIPVAEDNLDSDEALIVKKISRSMKMIGIPFDAMRQERERGFKTCIWMPVEDYESLGKPTVGDMLQFNVEIFKDAELKPSKPITPIPIETIVLQAVRRLQNTTGVLKFELIHDLIARKYTEQEIEKALYKLLRDGTIYEPKENYLKVT